ncbi:MAG: NAD(P)H:quinone oxidoreductase [Pseudomonadota bacterium]|nr:NAD(P)H:quinone oxidoreductase [Pseudomonadota bacterium]
MADILILYYSVHESTKKMARLIARGVETVEGVNAVLRTVSNENKKDKNSDPIVEINDLKNCSGLVLGSPTHFGNMAAPLKSFIDKTTSEWFSGTLAGKPAGVFTSTSSLHGGQETTLLSMMLPLIHHGMIIVGVPYTEKKLAATKSGGTPYGPSHVSYNNSEKITEEEKEICLSYGKRIAKIVVKLDC